MQRESGITSKFCRAYSIGLRVVEREEREEREADRLQAGRGRSGRRRALGDARERRETALGNEISNLKLGSGTHPLGLAGGRRGGSFFARPPHNIARESSGFPKGAPKPQQRGYSISYKGCHRALRRAPTEVLEGG